VTTPTNGERTRLREAVDLANIPTLLAVLTQLTGDEKWIESPFAPKRAGGIDDNDSGGLTPERQREVRDAAYAAIVDWKSGTPPALSSPSEHMLVRMLSVVMDEEVPEEYGPTMLDDLIDASIAPPRETAASDSALPNGFTAVIVGAGISGLCAARALDDIGVPYTIVERNDTVGGVWLENTYPGAGVDTPSHLYSFSRHPNDWKYYFALRDELVDYFARVADEAAISSRIRFRTSVESATYEEEAAQWRLVTRDADGRRDVLFASILISAVGGFNTPRVPDVEGLSTFTGTWFHSARWPEDLDLRGKRVAVVGNGASAMQIVPAIVDEVAHLTVFQRSPQWVAPFDKFRVPVPDPVRYLLGEVPLYRWWYRQRLNWTFNDRLHASLIKDPDWAHPERSLNALNDGYRRAFTRYIEKQLGDRQDLVPALLPDYPPYGKRILLDNGWYRALTRDHVDLVPEHVANVEGESVYSASGQKADVDVLIFATGFDVVRFLGTYDVIGRNGVRLRDEWNDDDSRAFLGTAVPGFPNLFMLYGPNTQAGHGGSLIWTFEKQVKYVTRLLDEMARGHIDAVEVRREVYEAYNDDIDEMHERMIWTHGGMSTYYRNSKGRVVVPIPFRNNEYFSRLSRSSLDDYMTHSAKNSGASLLT
jgi:4-hydroxyacetophenone monooxygenase